MDLTSLQAVLSVATTAVGFTGQAAETIEKLKNLLPKSKGGGDEAAPELIRVINTLANQLTTVNMMNVQLSSMLRSVAYEAERENQFDREFSRYQLIQTEMGDMLYALREEAANDEPIHNICPVCVSNERLFHFVVGNGDSKQCQSCKKWFMVTNAPKKERRVRPQPAFF
jgi:hypothetical protein